MLKFFLVLTSLNLFLCCGHQAKHKNARSGGDAATNDDSANSSDADNSRVEPDFVNVDGSPGELMLVAQTRRLTRAELQNTLTAIFGDQIWSETNIALLQEYDHEDQTTRIHGTNANTLNKGQLGAAISLAMGIAELTRQTPTLYSQIFQGCPGTPTMSCLDTFFNDRAATIWRRPLQAQEVKTLKASIPGAQPTTADLQVLLARMLSAPDFLFHIEDPCEDESCTDDPNFVMLSQYALANRLAYTLTESAPDHDLLAAAANNELSTPEQIRAQAERLIESPAAKGVIRAFFHDWLQSDKIKIPNNALQDYFAVESASLRSDAYNELDALFTYLSEKNYGDIFTTRYVNTASAPLKKLYGLTGSSTQLPQERGGVAARIGFLLSAGLSPNIVARGLQIKNNLLCQPVATPDINLIAQRDNELGEINTATMTNRQILELKTSPAVCTGCHTSINPPGFALEGFGPYGDIRSKDVVFNANGSVLAQLNLDTKTSMAIGSEKQTWSKADDFFAFLASSNEVKSCMTTRLFQFTRHLPAKTTNPIASSKFLADIKNDTSLKDLIINTLATTDFMLRKR